MGGYMALSKNFKTSLLEVKTIVLNKRMDEAAIIRASNTLHREWVLKEGRLCGDIWP